MTDSYKEGLVDGKLEAIEKMQSRQNVRLNEHSNRFKSIERILYGLIGAIGLIQLYSIVKPLL